MRYSALLARLVLAFRIVEPKDGSERKANVNMLSFSDEHRSVVAMPRRIDCCSEARDEDWLRTQLQ
jgi:phenylacetate 2-hydroxylase